MAFEDDLLALEQRVLRDAAGDFLDAVAELRTMLAAGAAGIERKLIQLAIPAVEALIKSGIGEAFTMGGEHAVTTIRGAEDVPAASIGDAVDRVAGPPSIRLTEPIDGLDQMLVDAKSTAVTLLSAGSPVEEALGPIFNAANTTSARTVTQVNQASNAGVIEVADATKSPLVWVSERDACVYCLALAGKVVQQAGDDFPKADLYADGGSANKIVQQPPLHPHCLPGDSVVTPGSRVTGATTRVFEGEMVRIRTLSGKELSITPNHPVLTDRGWISAGFLRPFDRVLSRSGGERPIRRHDHSEHVPALIREVAEAAFSSSEMMTAEVPMSAEDFHGDGTDGEVAHVATNLHLPTEYLSVCDEHVSELGLEVAGHVSTVGVGRCDSLAVELGVWSSPYGVVGSGGESSPLFWGRVRHTLEHRGGPVSWFDAALEQTVSDGASADPEAVGDVLLALAGEVIADEVVSVDRYAFHGEVFNLETETGWYTGNGIIVHNCRCQLEVLVDGSFADALEREAQRSILRGLSLGSESNAVRIRAAARLLERDPVAPKSVKEYARRAVKNGKFPNGRAVPDGGPRLVVR